MRHHVLAVSRFPSRLANCGIQSGRAGRRDNCLCVLRVRKDSRTSGLLLPHLDVPIAMLFESPNRAVLSDIEDNRLAEFLIVVSDAAERVFPGLFQLVERLLRIP